MSGQESIEGLVSKETVVPLSLEKNLSSNKLIEFHPNEELALKVSASLTPYGGDLILGNLFDIRNCLNCVHNCDDHSLLSRVVLHKQCKCNLNNPT